MKTAATGLWVLLGISFVPFVPFVFYGAAFLFLALLVMLVRWHLKFNSINTTDPDYRKAIRNKNVALVLWAVAIPGFVLRDIVILAVRDMLR